MTWHDMTRTTRHDRYEKRRRDATLPYFSARSENQLPQGSVTPQTRHCHLIRQHGDISVPRPPFYPPLLFSFDLAPYALQLTIELHLRGYPVLVYVFLFLVPVSWAGHVALADWMYHEMSERRPSWQRQRGSTRSLNASMKQQMTI